MREPRSLFMLIVLALATVIPLAASADLGAATGTPTPIMAKATPTPIGSEGIVCVDMSTVDEAAADSRAIFDRLGANNDPDPQALEGFRGELLDLVDALEEVADELPPGYPQLRDIQHSLKIERKRIQELTDEALYMIQTSFTDYKVAKAGIESAKSLARASNRTAIENDEGLGPSLGSFTTIPTPTPVTTPTPGIVHDTDVLGDINEETGDLFPPAWPTDVACPEQGYPPEVMFSLMVTIDVGKAASLVLDAMCKEKTVTCPGANPQDPIVCLAYAVVADVTSIIEHLRDGFAFCNGSADSARIEALYHDTEIIHADLDDHDQNLTTRFNWTDKFLFDFRNLNLRLNIEANLASPDDDPHALLALPRLVCISPELEALQLSDPFAPEVIAGCGLLEVVSDTVRSAIDMNQIAGQDINNAEAEFQAALEHYNNGEWKLAYARFRKAYREAVRP